ncbi:MbtH family protein [Derxia lacustris]|uniref:MbtH family protein n=1 Tax=Derxia lacustris TaxID=764842 RepID=UPI000A1701F7|nr:MbtH family NRPS accessory protein [Derxia lacustris]
MNSSCFDRDGETFVVLVNHEDQYSIWPDWKPVPGGWTVVAGIHGDKRAVLDHIDRLWTDPRPRSLREWMDANAAPSADPGLAADR